MSRYRTRPRVHQSAPRWHLGPKHLKLATAVKWEEWPRNAGVVSARALTGAARPDQILSIGWAPHEHLFAKARLVVHHAGAGTAATVCRAGVPSVAVPHLFDQYYWAGKLHCRGVSPEPIPRRELNAATLAARIEEALDEGFRQRAQALAEDVRAEDGVANAIARIEALVLS